MIQKSFSQYLPKNLKTFIHKDICTPMLIADYYLKKLNHAILSLAYNLIKGFAYTTCNSDAT